jgi:hypothetical protein
MTTTFVTVVFVGITVTLFDREEPEPQELFALTEMVPPVVPAVALMLVVDELPLHPEGKVHV